MSVTHPLLKELKVYILDLSRCTEGEEIRDQHVSLLPFCQTLENIFRAGLKATISSAFGRTKQDYWYWIHCLANKENLKLPCTAYNSIQAIQECKKVRNSQGKGRLFIRTALMKKFLKSVVGCFLLDQDFVLSMYESTSILGDEILSEIFTSLLYEVDRIGFKLNLRNASFLDDTWLIGIYKTYEFVPCKEMGITFGYVKGRAIVVKVEEGSVAGEDNQIEVGDVLDELYGRSLYGCRKGFIPSVAQQFQGLPVYLSVVKCQYLNGTIYTPLLGLLGKLGLTVRTEQVLPGKQDENCNREGGLNHDSRPAILDRTATPDTPSDEMNAHYSIYLLGEVQVGKEGVIAQIDGAITQMLQSREKRKVFMTIAETRVTVVDQKTNELLISKHFTEISSCGRKICCPEYLAFIAGETTCTLAEEFSCWVFQATTANECKEILCSIAQGFGRTHWEV